MSLSQPKCPTCSGTLVLTHEGSLDSWVCTSGHGLALTLTESYERLQEDEINLLWRLIRTPDPTPVDLECPMCERDMRAVDVGYDDDEVFEGEDGDGQNVGSVVLDVCEPCQVIWFDAGELDLFPVDLPDAEPSEEELAAVAEIRASFGQSIVDTVEARDAAQLTEKIYRRFFRKDDVFHRATGWMTSSR